METYVYKNQKWMKRGYTTGTCAAAAAKAAAMELFSGVAESEITLTTPSGTELTLAVETLELTDRLVRCNVKKDAGDDPDVTDQSNITAVVGLPSAFSDRGTPAGEREQLSLFGGTGIGRVTKRGLSVPVGEAAINPVPRQMILDAVLSVCREKHRTEPLVIRIEAERGEELAKKTFNPHLGIEGGISILGTSGIVEPMSEQALTETTRLELSMLQKSGSRQVLLTPGNYGADFTRMNLSVDSHKVVKCSNFIGEALDDAVGLEFQGILLLGHIGKFVKLAAGIMNTHSRQADGRAEIFAAHTALFGGRKQLIQQIMEAPTTDEILNLLTEANLRESVLPSILEKMLFHVRRRVGDQVQLGIMTFSNQHGFLGKIGEADSLLSQLG